MMIKNAKSFQKRIRLRLLTSCQECWTTTQIHGSGQNVVDPTSPNFSSKIYFSNIPKRSLNSIKCKIMIINCDITFIIFTFSGNYGHCLNSKPLVNHLVLKDRHSKMPGEYFDENQQCEFVFGNGSRICSYMVSCSCENKNYPSR